MIKLIIFDWDDVFTTGAIEAYYRCTQEALTAVGVHMSEAALNQRLKETWALGHIEQLQGILNDHPDKVDKAIYEYEKHWFGDTFVSGLTVVPGTQKFLLDLAKHYKLAVITGGHPSVLKNQIFPKFQIPDVFSSIFTIYELDDQRKVKPHPFMAEQTLKSLGVNADEAVLVGDAESDVQLARNAGIEPIVVLTGHLTREEAQNIGVKHIIENVTLLQKVLKKI